MAESYHAFSVLANHGGESFAQFGHLFAQPVYLGPCPDGTVTTTTVTALTARGLITPPATP